MSGLAQVLLVRLFRLLARGNTANNLRLSGLLRRTPSNEAVCGVARGRDKKEEKKKKRQG
eukprot:COSAG01_NODE_1677_length_9518_cov_11.599321_5_plen_60_part_00